METIAISKTPDKKQNSFHDHSMTRFIELFSFIKLVLSLLLVNQHPN